MPQTGQCYTVEFKPSHLDWGRYRHTNTRPRIAGESYIPIPATYAYRFDIRKGSTYSCTSTDGTFNAVLRASGNQSKIHPDFAKQFQGNGNLKILDEWLRDVCHAQPGDSVRVSWTSPNDMELTFIRSR